MKTLLSLFAGLILATAAMAQDVPSTPSLTYSFSKITNSTSTGQVGNYLILASASQGQAPSNFTIDWTDGGTAPSACTFRVEGSTDGVTWTGLDATSPGAISCLSGSLESIVNKPVALLRINLVSWTPGDSTSTVAFHFTGHK